MTRAAGCRFGSIATGATIFLAGSFSAVCQSYFGDLSILTVPDRRADVYRLAIGREMNGSPHVIRGMSADAKNRCCLGAVVACSMFRFNAPSIEFGISTVSAAANPRSKFRTWMKDAKK